MSRFSLETHLYKGIKLILNKPKIMDLQNILAQILDPVCSEVQILLSFPSDLVTQLSGLQSKELIIKGKNLGLRFTFSL